MKAELPENETQRLAALRSYGILDSAPERAFDDLTFLAAQICDTPIALVSLVDEKRQWFKSKLGTDTGETSRDVAFCAHTILHSDQVFEVRDALLDPRFAESELVTGGPMARFYAGAPIVDGKGNALGALCVLDRKPRELRPEQREALMALSRHVVAQLELRKHSRELSEEALRRKHIESQLRHQNERLASSQQETARLLELAEKSRGALLSILEDEQQASLELSRSNRSLQMLSSCNETLIWARDEPSLLEQICQIAVELGGHRLAFVGYPQDDEAKTIKTMAQWGDETGYLQEIDLTWGEAPTGRGPAGRCVRSGETVVCANLRDPASEFYSVEAAERRGFNSVICLPLKDDKKTFGILGLYWDESHDVSEGELKLLQELADDLAFGIGALRSREVRARAEEALVNSLREKEALLKEVHHRVKNNLQVIASLLRLEARRIDHAITKSVLREMQGRIQSMALLHETLYRSGNFSRVDLASYLSQLATQLFRSLGASPGSVALHLDLAKAHLEIDQAIPCGLIVNELASNSLKHGFPEGRTGDVWISLESQDEGRSLKLTVRDNGTGIPPNFDWQGQRSLGLQLVSDLARQLQGEMTMGPGPEARFEVTIVPTRTDGAETVPPPSKAIGASAPSAPIDNEPSRRTM